MHETFQQVTEDYLCSQQLRLDAQFNKILDMLFNNLQSIIPTSVLELINIQLHSLRINPPIFSQCNTINLPRDQLHILSTICNILGPINQKKYPYFFITGSAGTGKSFIINLIINDLNNKRSNYLLLAPTGVAAQHIGGKTIHSALRIHETIGGFQSLLAFHDYEFYKSLKKIDTLIFDEISMVSSLLFSFISDMFSIIQQTTIAFGGLNIIVVGDLAQLPAVTGLPIYKSSEWKLFYPLFLRQSQRHHQDPEYFNILEEIKF